jgi:hypothetical protein
MHMLLIIIFCLNCLIIIVYYFVDICLHFGEGYLLPNAKMAEANEPN